MGKLRAFHVMPLLPGREAELAADAEILLKTGVCTDIACILTLVPEGDPPENKAKILGDRFIAFRNSFKGDTSRLGILAQATIGHGWIPDEPAPYQKIIRPDGDPAYQMCPLGLAFQDYIREAFRHLAALKPAFFMIDDDFRLLTGRNGCYCPLHLAETGRRLGRTFTREALLDTLRMDPAAAREYDALLLDSLMRLARVIRDAIDETDPSIPGSFCTCYGDVRHAGPLSRILAGTGNPRVVRINNARYLTPEMRSFPVRMYHGAAQIAALDSDVTILAETDTCPQNRYSTGAGLMHAHYVGSILEGCHGAKHWITRTRLYQPASGAAYRAILTKHHRFYETLFNAVQDSVPSGYAAAVLPDTPFFNAAPDRGDSCASKKTWGALLGVLGLPCNYARMPDVPAMMTGSDVELFSDGDLRRLLKNGLLLEGRAAEKLCQRGFASEIGVVAEPWRGPRVSGEQWGRVVLSPDITYSRLNPTDPKTTVHLTLLHRKSGVSEAFTELGPAVTLFENALGGRVAVVAATFGLNNALSSFGFYDEDRKRELLELLEFVCGKPVEFYYPGDAEVYLKVRRFADGRYLLAFFNLGHDPLDILPVSSAFDIDAVEVIAPNGTWEPVDFADGCFQTPLLPAAPKAFRARVKGSPGA
ncbi:MAG: hypothetical protein ACP5JG_01170 [Anaerolineae bacterium]